MFGFLDVRNVVVIFCGPYKNVGVCRVCMTILFFVVQMKEMHAIL